MFVQGVDMDQLIDIILADLNNSSRSQGEINIFWRIYTGPAHVVLVV